MARVKAETIAHEHEEARKKAEMVVKEKVESEAKLKIELENKIKIEE